MAVAVQATTTTAWATGSTTLTLTKPTGTVDGDLLVAFVAANTTSSATSAVSTVPVGWTLLRTSSNTGSTQYAYLHSYYKIASSEGASWNWVLDTTSAWKAGMVYRIDGGTTVTSSDDGTANNTATPTFTGGVTPVGDSLLIIAANANDANNNPTTTSGYAIVTDNPTWTESADLYDTTVPDSIFSSAYANRTPITATGNWTLTYSAGSTMHSVSQLLTIPASTNVTTVLDTAGIITLSQPAIDVQFDFTLPIDSAGVVTVSGAEVTVSGEVKVQYTNQTKNSSNWTNQSKS